MKGVAMLKGAAYIRVSTDKQDEYSPEAQKRLIYEYAEKNNIIISPDDVYMEIGISGKQANKRPEFQNMIAKCKEKSHPIDVILVWKFSRFARNQEESIVYKRILKKINVDVVSISEPIPEGFIGELVERIFEWMDEYYSINLAGEVRRGMTQKALSGDYLSKAPYGYIRSGDSIPKINPQQAVIVKKIYSMFANDNKGFSTIARHLNSTNIKTSTGNQWSAKTVRYILQNPFYIGKIRWNYQPSDNTGRHINPDCIVVDGKHEPIIDEKTFELCQKKIKIYKDSNSADRVYSEKRKHWLSGILKCSSCGGGMGYASKGKGRTPYFRCIRYGRGQCNCSNGIVVPKIEKAVKDGLINAVTTHSYHVITKEPDMTELEAVRNAINMLSVKEERIRLAYMNGIDTIDDYQLNKNLINRERAELTKRLDELENVEMNQTTDMDAEIKTAAEILNNENTTEETKAVVLKSICDRIVYDKNTETLEFYFINRGVSDRT